MSAIQPYHTRPIRFIEIFRHTKWAIKIYSISYKQEYISYLDILQAKKHIHEWLQKTTLYGLDTYYIATLILHEGKEGCFAIINWWTDQNMLQNFVYLRKNNTTVFELYSDKGMCTCVWEMAVWWHERNAWVKHVLMNNEQPDFNAYLQEQLNIDI